MGRTVWPNKFRSVSNGCAVIITNKGGLPETTTNAKILKKLSIKKFGKII